MSKVTIENDRGRLRLTWLDPQGKRKKISIGAPDNPTGRALAKMKAAEIERDLLNGYYDSSLLRYKPKILGKNATELTVCELFKRYGEAMKKKKNLTRSGYEKYKSTLSHLKSFFGDGMAQSVTERRAGDFTAWLTERMLGQTAKQYLFLLRACWDWSKGKYHLAPGDNPWHEQIEKVEVKAAKKEKPFDSDEIKAILQAFESSRYYRHYYSFVKFLLNTGARPGEAAGLRWRNVSDSFGCVTITETISRREERDTTKTGVSRVCHVPANITQMLRELYEQRQPKAEDLVFLSKRGKAIDDGNFNRRAWKSIIQQVGIQYRVPYTVRHSALSHALENGANPVAVAEAAGHGVKVLLKTYAGSIKKESPFVEFDFREP